MVRMFPSRRTRISKKLCHGLVAFRHGDAQRRLAVVVGSYLQRDRRDLLRAARLNAAAEANAEDTSDPDFTPPATAGPAVGADGDAPPSEDAPRPARASRVRLAVAGSLALVARPLALG